MSQIRAINQSTSSVTLHHPRVLNSLKQIYMVKFFLLHFNVAHKESSSYEDKAENWLHTDGIVVVFYSKIAGGELIHVEKTICNRHEYGCECHQSLYCDLAAVSKLAKWIELNRISLTWIIITSPKARSFVMRKSFNDKIQLLEPTPLGLNIRI